MLRPKSRGEVVEKNASNCRRCIGMAYRIAGDVLGAPSHEFGTIIRMTRCQLVALFLFVRKS